MPEQARRGVHTLNSRHFVSFLEIPLDKNITLEPAQLAPEIAATFKSVSPLVAWLREALSGETANIRNEVDVSIPSGGCDAHIAKTHLQLALVEICRTAPLLKKNR